MLTPEAAEREKINGFIFEELVKGDFKSSTRDYFRRVTAELSGRGCDAVVMACTEIPLILAPEDVEVPLLDTTRILAKAAVAESLRSD
jgi:aspartate racemase